jgi:hypothetical protein
MSPADFLLFFLVPVFAGFGFGVRRDATRWDQNPTKVAFEEAHWGIRERRRKQEQKV